ncbi:MAG TPA: aminoglycoside phosphotransferase family protein [Acidimicrobiales bacterium]
MSVVDDPAGLTAAWLSDVLDAPVASVSVAPLGTGQMAACHRLEVTYRGDGSAHPSRLVAKLPSPDPTVRTSVATAYRTEVTFYRDLAPRLPVPTPRCWFADASEDGTAFTLLLDDMAPATPGDQFAGCAPEAARAAAVAVAGLHAGSWCDPALAALDWLIPPMSAVAEPLQPMLADLTETFIAKRDLTPTTAEVFRHFAAGFAEWATTPAEPWSLIHNDYRLDNLLFAPADASLPPVTAVDWQSLSTGLPLRDLAFLLGTGLDPESRRAHERAIVSAYHATLLSLGVTGYDAERCWEDYRHGLFQGPLICVLGEAFAAPTERGHRMFTVMAERAATAITG